MQLQFDVCPNCGQKVLKGAMRCVGCNTLLQTPEEREVLIQKYRESQKKFNIMNALKFIISVIIIGAIFVYFSDDIIEFVHKILEK
jgi:hypothetical protein